MTKSVLALSVSALIMLVLASQAFSGFQNWVMQAESVSVSDTQPLLTSGHIRHMVVTKATPQTQKDILNSQSVENNPPPVLTMSAQQKTSTVLPNNDLAEQQSDSQQPSVVVFEDEVVVEFPQTLSSPRLIKQALARLMLSETPFSTALLDKRPIDVSQRPYFFQRIADSDGKSIRYPAQAYQYIDQLISSEARKEVVDDEGRFVVMHIPLRKPNFPQAVERYQGWVATYAKEFVVEPELVFAVMKVESGFRPHAISRSRALGLMQVKADAAGKDVFQQVDGRLGQPSENQLLDEQENIRFGTAYLGLLKHDYFSKVRNPRNRELLAISSYNGGLSTVLRLFGESQEQAISQINRLHPRQVYRKLRFEHESAETRAYLDKVLKAKRHYQTVLNT